MIIINRILRLPVAIIALSTLFWSTQGWSIGAEWIVGSGNYSSAANWNIPRYPAILAISRSTFPPVSAQ